MNVFHKVTIETVKKNKVRTLVTIVGIMLSTALIFSVATTLYSFICFGKDMAIYNSGDWNGVAAPLTQDRVDELRDDSKIDEVFCLGAVGYADTGVKLHTEMKSYKYMVIAADEKCFENLPYHLKSGRYPENDSEIIISDIYFENNIDDAFRAAGKGEIGIGSTIDMDMTIDISGGIGDILTEEPDEEMLMEKASEITGTHKTYTIVGIYEQPYISEIMEGDWNNINCLTMGDSSSGSGIYTAFFKMKKAGNVGDYLNQNFNFNEDRNAGISTATNDELLAYSLSGGKADAGFLMSVFLIGSIVFGIIIFGSVALIYNAFAISVSERTKQFGLLSSIGATKKQINKMIEFEALLLSLIGIPLGILLGYCGIGITFKALSTRFDTITKMISDSNPVPFKLHVSWIVILISILVAEFTVRLSAWIPSVRAQRISAVEAIRQSGDIKAKNKKIRTPKIIYKLFGLPGVLAQKYFKRSKKRYRATVWSLFMSITLFISAYAFTTGLVRSVEEEMGTEHYDIQYLTSFNDDESADKLFAKLKDADEVYEAACSEYIEMRANADEDVINSEANDVFHYTSVTESTDKTVETVVFFVDNDTYRDFLKENGYDTDKYMDPEHPMALTYDIHEEYDIVDSKTFKYHIFDSDDEKKVKIEYDYDPKGYVRDSIADGKIRFVKAAYNVSDDPDEIYLTKEETWVEHDIAVGARLSKRPFFAVGDYYNECTFIFPKSLRDSVIPKHSNKYSYSYTFLSNDHKESYNAIKEIINAEGGDDEFIYDYAAEVEYIRNMVVIIKVFAYGFIVIISLIAAANVFNTISTNIALRRREFAMLRSIGMGTKGLNRMMNFECLLYGGKSLLFGLPISFLIAYFINKGFNSANSDITFELPWKAAIISATSVFIVVFSTMIYSMRKIKKDNPIDALKNENL